MCLWLDRLDVICVHNINVREFFRLRRVWLQSDHPNELIQLQITYLKWISKCFSYLFCRKAFTILQMIAAACVSYSSARLDLHICVNPTGGQWCHRSP